MSAFANAFAALNATLKAVNGQAVTYASGTSSASVTAVVGSSTFPMEDNNGLLTNLETRDYLIEVADLKLAGTPVQPQTGDRITETSKTYQVVAPAGEKAWRYSDPTQQKYRIHTKFVGIA